jgi:5'/3'-nucleotidase SurE
LSILVTNDDGVTAPGINATVQALAALPHTKVIVVAPLTNQSGTGAKVTNGALTATSAMTAGGYPAKAGLGTRRTQPGPSMTMASRGADRRLGDQP